LISVKEMKKNNISKSISKKLFLFDGFGAILSALLLGVVLVELESIFGIPRKTLYFLAFLPCLFATYDFFCYFRIETNISKFLKGIAYVNILYCLISLTLAIYHSDKLTYFGWTYISLEILIVIVLANIELKTSISIDSK